VLAADAAVGACDQREQVAGDRRGGGQVPAQAARAGRSRGPGHAVAEPDVGDRAERVLTAAEVRVDVMAAEVDQPATLLRLGVGQRTRVLPMSARLAQPSAA
jgi:hypothetical protein